MAYYANSPKALMNARIKALRDAARIGVADIEVGRHGCA
jgi:hypothetical protein